jgi:CcmD family protein
MDANIVVMIVTLIVWAGIFVYLMSLDRRLRKIERKREG